MEIEVTYDQFLNYYPSSQTDFSKIIPKNLQKEYRLLYFPPFVIILGENINQNELDNGNLLDLYNVLQKFQNNFQQSFDLLKSTFYFTYIEEEYSIAKDGFDNAVICLGPFYPKQVIILGICREFKNKRFQFLKNLLNFQQKIQMQLDIKKN